MKRQTDRRGTFKKRQVLSLRKRRMKKEQENTSAEHTHTPKSTHTHTQLDRTEQTTLVLPVQTTFGGFVFVDL